MRDYSPLPVAAPLGSQLRLAHSEAHAELTDPAVAVFTDLRVAPAVVVPAAEPLTDTRRLMQLAGVRMAFVVDAAGGVVGLVTAADLQGEWPMRVAGARGMVQRDLSVADVMTANADWLSLDVSRLANARVGHVVATFRAAGQRYLIVTEPGGGGGTLPSLAPIADATAPAVAPPPVVRGLFSANRVERALGHTIDIELRSRSFADLAVALAHG